MLGFKGDDLTVFWGFLSLTVFFGYEAVKERAARRYVLGAIAGVCVVTIVFWFQIKAAAPEFASAVSQVAKNPNSWFFLLLSAALIFILDRRLLAGNKPADQPPAVTQAARAPATVPAALPDPPEVAQAKLRLANVVIQHFEPALAAEREALAKAKDAIASWSYGSPQESFAAKALQMAQPSANLLKFAEDPGEVRATSLQQLEHKLQVAMTEYSGAGAMAFEAMHRLRQVQTFLPREQFFDAFTKWADKHFLLQDALMKLSQDVEFRGTRQLFRNATMLGREKDEAIRQFIVDRATTRREGSSPQSPA